MLYVVRAAPTSIITGNWVISNWYQSPLHVSIKKLQNKHLTLDPDPCRVVQGDANRTLSKHTVFLQTNTPEPNKSQWFEKMLILPEKLTVDAEKLCLYPSWFIKVGDLEQIIFCWSRNICTHFCRWEKKGYASSCWYKNISEYVRIMLA